MPSTTEYYWIHFQESMAAFLTLSILMAGLVSSLNSATLEFHPSKQSLRKPTSSSLDDLWRKYLEVHNKKYTGEELLLRWLFSIHPISVVSLGSCKKWVIHSFSGHQAEIVGRQRPSDCYTQLGVWFGVAFIHTWSQWICWLGQYFDTYPIIHLLNGCILVITESLVFMHEYRPRMSMPSCGASVLILLLELGSHFFLRGVRKISPRL